MINLLSSLWYVFAKYYEYLLKIIRGTTYLKVLNCDPYLIIIQNTSYVNSLRLNFFFNYDLHFATNPWLFQNTKSLNIWWILCHPKGLAVTIYIWLDLDWTVCFVIDIVFAIWNRGYLFFVSQVDFKWLDWMISLRNMHTSWIQTKLSINGPCTFSWQLVKSVWI
jgi:hypothetical protein